MPVKIKSEGPKETKAHLKVAQRKSTTYKSHKETKSSNKNKHYVKELIQPTCDNELTKPTALTHSKHSHQ